MVRMASRLSYVAIFAFPVALVGVLTLRYQLPIGPIILALTLIPSLGILVARKSLVGGIPDMIFGAIDTGLLTIPALWGGILFGMSLRSNESIIS